MTEEELKSDFCLEIDFEENSSEDPSRIFKAMSGLIDGFQLLDLSLAQSIDVNIRTQLVLHTIEAGSLKSWLRNIVKSINDENLKNLNWKPIVGEYLLKAKHSILKHLEDKDSLQELNIEAVQEEICQMAEKTDIRKMPYYAPVERRKLLEFSITTLKATSVLSERDDTKYISSHGQIILPKGHDISEELKEQILTQKTIIGETVLVLRVKKPDYLGQSMWIFQHEGHAFEASIEDKGWLSAFQERKVVVHPGDSLNARVKTEIKKGYDGEISVHNDIIEVMEVIRANSTAQSTFFPENGPVD